MAVPDWDELDDDQAAAAVQTLMARTGTRAALLRRGVSVSLWTLGELDALRHDLRQASERRTHPDTVAALDREIQALEEFGHRRKRLEAWDTPGPWQSGDGKRGAPKQRGARASPGAAAPKGQGRPGRRTARRTDRRTKAPGGYPQDASGA